MNKESLLYYFFLIFLCVGVLVMNKEWPILNRFERYNTMELPIIDYDIVEYKGQKYLLVVKPDAVADRVIKIDVKEGE